MVRRLQAAGVSLDEGELRQQTGGGTLGRRNLAEFLVRTGQVSSVQQAFARYLGDGSRVAVPKVRLPLAEGLALVRGAGGVASWAHPPYDCTRERLAELRRLGLGAVEVEYPGVGPGRSRELRRWARELGLAVTGGSDCHGPGHYRRAVGARSVTAEELEVLRRLARSSDSAA
jgi:predicted metal-dependent phosphoesterase TrpH